MFGWAAVGPLGSVLLSSFDFFCMLETMRRSFGDVPSVFADPLPLGRGAFGDVYSAREIQNSGLEQRVAVKRIAITSSSKYQYQHVACLREIRILRALSSDADSASVARLDRVFAATTANGERLLSLHLVMPCMDTDLRRLLRDLGNGCLGCQASEWLGFTKLISYQIFRALHFVHSCNVVHRDVKPSNILVNVGCGRPFAVALCDFGMARVVDEDYDHSGYLTDEVVTRWYRPPEVLFASRTYSRSVDVWSAGCVLAEMLVCGAGVLFRGRNDKDQLRRIVQVLGWPGEETFERVITGRLEDDGFLRELVKGPSGRSFSDIFPQEARMEGMFGFHPSNSVRVCLRFSFPFSVIQCAEFVGFFSGRPLSPRLFPAIGTYMHEDHNERRTDVLERRDSVCVATGAGTTARRQHDGHITDSCTCTVSSSFARRCCGLAWHLSAVYVLHVSHGQGKSPLCLQGHALRG